MYLSAAFLSILISHAPIQTRQQPAVHGNGGIGDQQPCHNYLKSQTSLAWKVAIDLQSVLTKVCCKHGSDISRLAKGLSVNILNACASLRCSWTFEVAAPTTCTSTQWCVHQTKSHPQLLTREEHNGRERCQTSHKSSAVY